MPRRYESASVNRKGFSLRTYGIWVRHPCGRSPACDCASRCDDKGSGWRYYDQRICLAAAHWLEQLIAEHRVVPTRPPLRIPLADPAVLTRFRPLS